LLYGWKTFLPLFLSLLLFSLLVTVPVRSEVIHPYDWVKVGAYAKYTSANQRLTVKFPNGTRLAFDYAPAVLEWAIIEKQGDTVRLNVTLFISGPADILPAGVTVLGAEELNVTYLKTLFFDVDVSTREASLDGQPVGETFFWAEPYAAAGEEFIVSSPPSDSIVGNVTYVRTFSFPGVGKEITTYGVFANQRDPYAMASYVFSWYTGVVIEPTLLAPWVIPPELMGHFSVKFQNGTTFNITRYAGDPVGANLGLDAASGSFMVEFGLNETNIDLSAQTVPEPAATDAGIWGYLPYAFVATFVGLAVVFVIVRRRKK
jgi:hypothetical protein